MQGSYTKRPTSPLQQQPHSWTQLPGSQPPVCFLLCGRRPTRLPRQHRELLSKADAPHLSLLDSITLPKLGYGEQARGRRNSQAALCQESARRAFCHVGQNSSHKGTFALRPHQEAPRRPFCAPQPQPARAPCGRTAGKLPAWHQVDRALT